MLPNVAMNDHDLTNLLELPKRASGYTQSISSVVEWTQRPPLKWAGGKRWLVPHIAPLWKPQRHRRLVEPLCGGSAVTLGLRPQQALLNDINPHTVNFHQWLKKGLRIELPMENEEAFFYEYRRRFNQLVRDGGRDSREAASLFYYLNCTCYNGLCRFNQKGGFNVPFGRYQQIRYK